MIAALSLLLSAALAFTPAPRDFLAAEMILTEIAQDGTLRRSETIADEGQCRRFQATSFASAAQGYRLAGHPDVPLYLPTAHAERAVSGRQVGACWDMPDASTGNAYVEAARFDYDRDKTLGENKRAARAFLAQALAGDVLQLFATYASGGRGTHTVLMTRPFDPRSGMLYWADSNFANTLVDGVRFGYVRAWQQWPLEEVVTWLTTDLNNGATLYRISEAVVRATDAP